MKHAKEIARLMKLQEYEPEVALAVRIPCTHNSAETEDEGEDENSDIDGMLLSCGFEYVDATRSEGEDGMEDGAFSDLCMISMLNTISDRVDIPALPRVLDALSTIIWPSMRPNKVEPGGPKIPLDLNQSFDTIDSEDDELEREKETMLQELLRESLSGGDEDEDDGEVGENDDDDDDDQDFVAQMKAVILETAMKREWERNRPWISVSGSSSTTATMTESPIEETVRDGEEGVPDKEKEALRFEDDFSGFVSAPEETDAGFSYRTLGSVSDFGECDTGEIFEELDAYKSKISAIEDEQEKRMKAAQIALGVVYGL